MQARKDREALVALRNQASNNLMNNNMGIRTEPSQGKIDGEDKGEVVN